MDHAADRGRPAGRPRTAVRMRKASYGSKGARGAATRGVRMSVCRTRKNRGLDPLQTILDALRAYATTGTRCHRCRRKPVQEAEGLPRDQFPMTHQ
ncbi:hypothetical protein [Urbifossiella limnaea]|uniref:Uncharacterized protein n=1 Tax=Urbifossiella limnaea TaxID=2528023 RepID=A0A517XTE1_9BACT|nr:hypothetical protein [Urbifossiella limnaea]QDU20763.1 hypothetical protein ETAA1_27230 [Urbifossiella limnaea]